MGARHAAAHAKPPPRVTLIYGNQEHAMERAAEALLDAVLGAGARDFSLQRCHPFRLDPGREKKSVAGRH